MCTNVHTCILYVRLYHTSSMKKGSNDATERKEAHNLLLHAGNAGSLGLNGARCEAFL